MKTIAVDYETVQMLCTYSLRVQITDVCVCVCVRVLCVSSLRCPIVAAVVV